MVRMTSEFVRQLQVVFQTDDDRIEQFRQLVYQILEFVRYPSIVQFVEQFYYDADKVAKPAIGDAKFIEISTLAQLVLGKNTHYNQGKHYYALQGTNILSALSQLRFILERIYPHKLYVRFVKLLHLSWTYRVFKYFLELQDATFSSASSSLYVQINYVEEILTGIRSDLSFSYLNNVIGRFMLTYRFLLSRVLGSKLPLYELINEYLRASRAQDIPIGPSPSETARDMKDQQFESVFDMAEMVQTYLCQSAFIVGVDAICVLADWLFTAKEAFGYLSGVENVPLAVLFAYVIRKDLHRYLMNTNVIVEPEMYSVLLCFMISHEIVWFYGSEIVSFLELQIKRLHELFNSYFAGVQETFEEQCTALFQKLRYSRGGDAVEQENLEKRVVFKQEIACEELITWIKDNFERCCMDTRRMFSGVFNLFYRLYVCFQPYTDQRVVSIMEGSEALDIRADVLLTESRASLGQ